MKGKAGQRGEAPWSRRSQGNFLPGLGSPGVRLVNLAELLTSVGFSSLFWKMRTVAVPTP